MQLLIAPHSSATCGHPQHWPESVSGASTVTTVFLSCRRGTDIRPAQPFLQGRVRAASDKKASTSRVESVSNHDFLGDLPNSFPATPHCTSNPSPPVPHVPRAAGKHRHLSGKYLELLHSLNLSTTPAETTSVLPHSPDVARGTHFPTAGGNVKPIDRNMYRYVLGVDFGGSGIKGAPVDTHLGELLCPRVRIPTPEPATPEAVADVIGQLEREFQWNGPIGVGVPSVVKRGIVRSAANIDKTWINVNAVDLFEKSTGCPVAALNDADAAGYAEMQFGSGRPFQTEGTVLMLTFGTGIGSALFVDGRLVPNLELGHVEVCGEVAEKVASGSVRERDELSWKKWVGRVNEYLLRVDQYTQPDLIVIGGGVSKKDDKFLHLLSVPSGTPIVVASMRNEAGIVGAAVGAAIVFEREDKTAAMKDLEQSLLF